MEHCIGVQKLQKAFIIRINIALNEEIKINEKIKMCLCICICFFVSLF